MLLFVVKLVILATKVKNSITVKPRNLFIMKRIYLSLMLLLGVTTASAQNYDYLILQENSGNATGLKIDGLKLTFDKGNLVAQKMLKAPKPLLWPICRKCISHPIPPR